MFVKPNEQTHLYRQAVEALSKLLEAEGRDMVTRAYAEVSSRVICQEATKGLKKSTSTCIYRLLGRKTRSDEPPGTDHPSLWNKDGKPELFISQPYGLSWGKLRELVAFCETHGLEVNMDAGTSWYFPGRSLRVVFRKVRVEDYESKRRM
jgi:hypothetical protein